MKKIFAVIISGVFMLTASVAMAGHVTPTAPGDYLSKKSPKISKKALKKGAKIYKKKCSKCQIGRAHV